MSDFVHLHLHTEFSLLDGACRIDELLDQAAKLKMPAIAVTEHGNMFSSVIFHDHARQHGIKPILGLRGLRRAGQPADQERHARRDGESSGAARGDQRGLPQPDQAGVVRDTPRASTTSRASTRNCWRAHSKGLIGLSSCLKGEVAEGLSHQQERKAIEAAAAYRDILGPDNFFLEMQWHGIEDQRVVNTGLPAIARDLGPAAGLHQRRALRPRDRRASRTTSCSASAPARRTAIRSGCATRAGNFFLKTAERDGRGVQGFSGRAGEHGADRRAVQRQAARKARTSCRTSTCPAPYHARRLLRARRARRVQGTADAAAAAGDRRRAAAHDRRVRAAAVVRDRHDQADEVPRVLPDRVGLHPLRARAGHSGRPGPRLGGRQPGRVLPAHHRRRSARLRSHLRALPQPRARVAARHRHRLLRAAARRGDRVRDAEVRPRERRADHHVRHDEGQGGRPRRRPRARDAVRRRRQGRQADSGGARHDARQGARGDRRRSRRWSRPIPRSRSCSRSPAGSKA